MIYTFYSYKGGVGRSMALANLAELFYGLGLSVLMVDFDLEAPGLERYFTIDESQGEADRDAQMPSRRSVLARRGVVDMLLSYQDIYSLLAIAPPQLAQLADSTATQTSSTQTSLAQTSLAQTPPHSKQAAAQKSFVAEPLEKFCTLLKEDSETGAKLQLITAGKRDGQHFARYTKSIQAFSWNDFYVNQEGEKFFDWFRLEAEKISDIVLIDSRTGITEMGGTCTHQLADCVLLFVGANQQNVSGTLKIISSLTSRSLIDQSRHGRPLTVLPIPSRIENAEKTSLDNFAKQFKKTLGLFVPKHIRFEEDVFDDLKIPYVPYYAFRERVAAREHNNDGSKDLVHAFKRLASIMAELSPKGSKIRALADPKGKRGIAHNLPKSGVVRFVGRSQELDELTRLINRASGEKALHNNRPRVVAIVGTAGVGKTELALQYAQAQYKARQYPGGLCWLKAVRQGREKAPKEGNIAEQIVRFATEQLGLSPAEGECWQQVDECWQHWPQGRTLIVVDDVTDYAAIAPYLPSRYPQFDILLTSRQTLSDEVQPLELQALNANGALDLLSSLAEALNLQAQLDKVQALSERVGYLPLALDIIGRVLNRMSDASSVGSLLKSVEENTLSESVLNSAAGDMTAQVGVPEALSLSWQALSAPEQTLACLISLFAPKPVPWRLIETCAAYLQQDELVENLTQHRERLMSHRLLFRLAGERYQLHRLMQDFVRSQLTHQPDAGRSIQDAFCRGIAQSAATMKGVDPKQTAEQSDTIEHFKVAIARFSDELSGAEQLTLQAAVGQFYANQGDYEQAEGWYEKVRVLTQQVHEGDLDAIAQSLNKLAAIYHEQGKYTEAEPLYTEALEKRRERWGAVHPQVADVMENLAILYNTQQQYDKAKELFREVLAMRREVDDGEAYARSLNNLATLYDMIGETDQAETHYRESLKINRQILGLDHPNVATGLYNLAELYRTKQHYSEAASLYREALKMQKQTLGEHHPDVKMTAKRLETLYQTMRR